MFSTEFSKICKDLSQFGDSLVISCTKPGEVKFFASDDTVSGNSTAYLYKIIIKYLFIHIANIKLTQTSSCGTEEDNVIIQSRHSVCSTFDCHYLNLFCKATPLSSKVL